MPTITFTLPVAGQDADAGPIATNFNDLQTLLNGGLDGANFVNASLTLGASFALNIGGDTNLYRSSANVLRTDDQFLAGSYVQAHSNLTGQVYMGAAGPGEAPGIVFGNAGDTNLYRSAANTLKTDDIFASATYVFADQGGSTQVRLGNESGSAAITFGSGFDASIYRVGVNVLKTAGNFQVGDQMELNNAGIILLGEIADPSGAGNVGKLYCRDNGAGKTQLCVKFASGAVQVLATEP